MPNEIEKNTFASQKPQPTELERITERITNYKVGLTPNNAQTVNTVLEKGLQQGIFKLSELDALVAIREEVNKGIIDYNTQVKVAQNRLNELQQEELLAKQTELAKREAERSQELTDERQRRKKAEDEVRILKAQLEVLSGVVGNVTSAPVAVEQPHAPKVEKPKSKAWDMIRAGRPHIDDAYDSDLSGTIKTEPKDDPDLVEAITPDETTLSRREQVLLDPLGASQKDATTTSVDKVIELDVPKDAKTVKDFFEEVQRVSEENQTREIPQERLRPTHYMEDTFEELEASQESDFKFVEEDVKTKPTFSGPKITGGNAPNIKAVIEEPKTVEAKLEKQIPTFNSEEELLADAKRRAEEKKAQQGAEEEFEEVTIPSESELRGMTKTEIETIAKTLGFESVITSLTKDKMIDNFLSETDSFITNLQESGEFVSATETDTEKTKDADDIRDGGYF
jgi:hypothetical protein